MGEGDEKGICAPTGPKKAIGAHNPQLSFNKGQNRRYRACLAPFSAHNPPALDSYILIIDI